MIHVPWQIHNVCNARRAGFRHHRIPVSIEFRRIKVTMAVDPHAAPTYAARLAASARLTRECGALPSACEMN